MYMYEMRRASFILNKYARICPERYERLSRIIFSKTMLRRRIETLCVAQRWARANVNHHKNGGGAAAAVEVNCESKQFAAFLDGATAIANDTGIAI